MAKEKDMINPNSLGHYYRDIVTAERYSRWHMVVTMSCGHVKGMSRQSFNNHLGHATLCMTCTKERREK